MRLHGLPKPPATHLNGVRLKPTYIARLFGQPLAHRVNAISHLLSSQLLAACHVFDCEAVPEVLGDLVESAVLESLAPCHCRGH